MKKHTIDFANQAGSVAQALMEYDMKFGEGLDIFFEELITILSAYEEEQK